MKKLNLILVFAILISLFSFSAIAASDEELIYVSNFRFEDANGNRNALASNSYVYAKCDIERTDDDEEKTVPYELVMQIRINGKLVSLTSTKGVLNVADGVVPVQVEGYINGDASNCELTAYLFGDVGSLVPLANCAIYGSDTAVLDRITVNNQIIPGFKPDVFNYVYRFEKYPAQIPILRFYPSDLASFSEISGGFPKSLSYKIDSSDESDSNEYTVEFDIAKNKKSIICEDQKEKRRDSTTFKVFDIASETDYTTLVAAKLSSYINNTAVNSSNINKFTTSSYLTFDFDGCDVALSEPITLFIRGKYSRDTIYQGLNISLYSYDSTSFTAPDYYGYYGEKIASKNVYSDGVATANNQYYDYTFDITDYVASELAQGNTSITFILTFDDSLVTECWNLIKENSWPDGKSKDLTFGYVLNTASTRKHNGTSVIYGDGQPTINYYEYVK